MIVHLVDGTYELYRQYFGRASRYASANDNSGVAGVLNSTLRLIESGATHVGVAIDHVIESFRNDLWTGYKTSEGMEPDILRQIPILGDALAAMGVTVWRMVDFEADDALASATRVALQDRRVHQVQLLTPDKDLGQCVRGRRVVQVDRRNDSLVDDAAVRSRLGVDPESVVDYLALVGDNADGFPGLPGWGAKTASSLLARYGSIASIPPSHEQWREDGVQVRGAEKLAATLNEQRTDAELFRVLAALIDTVDVGLVDDWSYNGLHPEFIELMDLWGYSEIGKRAASLRRLK